MGEDVDMAPVIIYNKPFISQWLSHQIPGAGEYPLDAPNMAYLKDGHVCGAVIYTWPSGNGCMMSVASDGTRRWFNRTFLRAAFAYPFIQMGYARVSGLVRVDNFDAQRFDEHLGFKKEGILRHGDDDGTDLILYGMLKEECRWLNI